MRTLWDSSELKDVAALFDGILARSGTPPVSPGGPPAGERVWKSVYRGGQLEEELVSLCTRGKFRTAVLADIHGLPLAAHNSPVATDALAASTSVLGESLEKTARMLNRSGADNISADIDHRDKIVLRKFFIDNQPYFLMIIGPRYLDESADIELSIDYISTILKKQ